MFRFCGRYGSVVPPSSMICRVRSWSSGSRARSFFALSNKGWYAASSAGDHRGGKGLSPVLRGPLAEGAGHRGGGGWAPRGRLSAGVGGGGGGSAGLGGGGGNVRSVPGAARAGGGGGGGVPPRR